MVNFRVGELARYFRGKYYNWSLYGKSYRDIYMELVKKEIKREYEKQK